jgi:hypothetical protein
MKLGHWLFAASILSIAGCDTKTSATSPSSASATVSAIPSASAATATAQAFHYDLLLTVTEGSTTTKTALSVDASESVPGEVSFGKNVVIGGGNARSDVGTRIKAKVTMEGSVPRLAVEMSHSGLDPKGAVYKVSLNGAAATPLGNTTNVIDAGVEGRKVVLSATPSAALDLGAAAPSTSLSLDVAIAQTGATTKNTALSLAVTGDTPALAKTGESVPLGVGPDGGIGTPRQDTGSRVKTTARAHANGAVLEMDLEVSAAEGTSGPAVIRKLRMHGPVAVMFDKPTKIFTADDNGQRYEVTATAKKK